MDRVFALVDCNSFYASCEKVFAPALGNRPVVVLSNNDGCIVARSAEAKAVGIPMGTPLFQCQGLIKRHNVAVFSSNYALYGDLSARVMSILARFTPSLEVYSIDEAFLDLTGLPGNVVAYCRHIREIVVRWIGIPVSIGIGSTKTLAKVANRTAKNDASRGGVFDFGACADPDGLLERFPVAEVWGIGRRYAAMLARYGVANARQFRDLPRDWVKKKMTVDGLQTQLELRGLPCFGPEETSRVRKTIVSSRSFGRPVTSIEDMREALAMHVSRAGERLRAGRLVANGITIWVQTNTFIAGEPQYANSSFAAFRMATSHTGDILKSAVPVLDGIFRPGFRYKKIGVMLSGLERLGNRQRSLLDPAPAGDGRGERLMAAMDTVNARFGRDTLRLAACGLEQPWQMRQARRSPRYTTAWDELPVVTAKASGCWPHDSRLGGGHASQVGGGGDGSLGAHAGLLHAIAQAVPALGLGTNGLGHFGGRIAGDADLLPVHSLFSRELVYTLVSRSLAAAARKPERVRPSRLALASMSRSSCLLMEMLIRTGGVSSAGLGTRAAWMPGGTISAESAEGGGTSLFSSRKV